jgi:hypothetical protein
MGFSASANRRSRNLVGRDVVHTPLSLVQSEIGLGATEPGDLPASTSRPQPALTPGKARVWRPLAGEACARQRQSRTRTRGQSLTSSEARPQSGQQPPRGTSSTSRSSRSPTSTTRFTRILKTDEAAKVILHPLFLPASRSMTTQSLMRAVDVSTPSTPVLQQDPKTGPPAAVERWLCQSR